MSKLPFTHLHTHSHYSLLQALPQIDTLVKAAKADGQSALALTDAGNLYGAIDFYKACQKNGIKPIIGVDAYVAARTRHDKEHRVDNRSARLVLLAKDTRGYKNLIELVTKSYLEGFYYNPRIDRELLEQYHEGLIALIPSFAGEPSRALKEGDAARAHESMAFYRDLFGEDCYQEITHHPEIEGHEELMKRLIALSGEMHVPIAAAHDTYYMKPEDAFARELVIKIRTGERLDREMGVGRDDFSFITSEHANELFADLPEALLNTQKIADACTVDINLGSWVFPNYPIPAGTDHDTILHDFAYSGIPIRELDATPELKERLDYELSVIAKKGYSAYFLVVADLLKHARENGIFTNTRGSAAGSLTSYLCGITTVNPLEYGLPFERFLNPDRPSPPDIDMDIADNRRDDLIDYARAKYGADHVAQIGTFGTMLARAAVRDVARALGHSYATGDLIAKTIPPPKQGFPVTIQSALRDVPELKEIYDTDMDAREIMDLAQKIEGNARHVGVHAAGVVIAPTPVTDFVPLQFDPKGGKMITQYDMHAVEDAGLLKFDFLGLTNLSVLAGVFQFASSGMTSYLVELQPTEIHDLNAMVALYRPGPMAFIPDYIERKKNPALITYLDPRMESILKRSYGIIAYQDDVLMIAIQLSGYSWIEADKFRKAIGKKIPEEMAAQKERFMNGMKPEVVQRLWDQIETFAAYGFNKAHAASYGNLAYKTAYMKANYAVDYMAALLTAEDGDVEEISLTVAECLRMGIKVLPPDVNESRGDFTVVDDDSIRFGLYSIKNFGQGIGDAIITERDSNGPYRDLADLLSRVRDKNLNRKSLEALIQCGALDAFAERNRALNSIELLLAYHKEHMNVAEDQDSLFGAMPAATAPFTLPDAPPMSPSTMLRLEKELLGLYISGHPLDPFYETLKRQKFDIEGTKEKMHEGITTVIGGMLESVQTILTKNGEKMAFGKLADHSGSIEIVAFPRIYKEYETLFRPEQCVLIEGKMSTRGTEKSFIADIVCELK
jgi:DNA polymerase-3 subunit alpha